MKKIIIIGSGGAGKSTLAKKLGEELKLDVIHLDSLFWKPNWTPTNREEWMDIQKELLNKESWIIDGNYGSTLELRMEAADTIIFLDYSTVRCLYGVIKRRIQNHGKTRPDMGEGCPEKLDWEFIKWVLEYKKKKSPSIKQKLTAFSDKKILHFCSPKETSEFLTRI